LSIPLWGFFVFLLYTMRLFSHFLGKVFDAVEHVVTWGLEHRTLGQIDAIGVDEIQYAKSHKHLTQVYQIDIGITRLLWVGKQRTIESFQGFFTTMGHEVISRIVSICSYISKPTLDRFHIVAKMNKTLDEGPRRGGAPHEAKGATRS
jgi:transposase